MRREDLPQGTVEIFVLTILALGPKHGRGISNRIHHMSGDTLAAGQGALYPELHRFELRAYLCSDMAHQKAVEKRGSTQLRRHDACALARRPSRGSRSFCRCGRYCGRCETT